MKTDYKKTLKNVIFLLLVVKMCIVFGQKKVVVIDVGHGGKDTGAIGINGILEKDVVLNIAKEILSLNKTILNDELDVYLTRYKDTWVSLSDRSRLAKSLEADVFVSLHCNASQNFSKGIEVYVYNSNNSNSSILLSVTILNESTQKLGFKKRSVKFANFQVLRETVAFFPAILLELGFITNVDEADYFLKPTNVRALAMAVLMGINHFLNTQL